MHNKNCIYITDIINFIRATEWWNEIEHFLSIKNYFQTYVFSQSVLQHTIQTKELRFLDSKWLLTQVKQDIN